MIKPRMEGGGCDHTSHRPPRSGRSPLQSSYISGSSNNNDRVCFLFILSLLMQIHIHISASWWIAIDKVGQSGEPCWPRLSETDSFRTRSVTLHIYVRVVFLCHVSGRLVYCDEMWGDINRLSDISASLVPYRWGRAMTAGCSDLNRVW